jgi:hypothetical protein
MNSGRSGFEEEQAALAKRGAEFGVEMGSLRINM